jgi:hypothetical protein
MVSDVRATPTGYERALLWLVASVPVAVTLWRASSSVQWRGDLAAVRDQGLVALDFGGTLATVVTQAMGMLPIGTLAFRAALASAVAVGVSAVLVHRIAGRWLAGHPGLPRPLASLLATIAAMMAALGPAWQQEGTLGGGAMFAVALVLLAVDQAMLLVERPTLTPEATQRWLLLAATLGLTFAESIPSGLAATTAVAAVVTTAGRLPRLRLAGWLVALVAGVAALGFASLLLRPLSPGSWSDIGRALSAASLDTLEVEAVRKTTLLAWLDDVGLLILALSTLGLGIGVFRERLRAPVAGLVVLLLFDLLYPPAATSPLVPEPLAALRCGAFATFAITAAAGVGEVVAFLRGLRIPMARTAMVLTVAFHVTLVAVTSEDAAFAANRSDHVAAEEWTDEALVRLPRDAALFVHSPVLTWRLWAAQMLRGERPDVLVVPVPMVRHGRVTNNLLPSEPAVAQLLRDLALTGEASEYSLSLLADARPLLVELDPRWDERIISHLTIEGPWLRFAPQVLGPSDRKIAGHVLVGDGRIPIGIRASLAADRPSAAVVTKTIKEHVAALSLLGMGDIARVWIDGVEVLEPDDPFVVGARLRLAYAAQQRKSRPVELRDLLAF